MADLFVSKLKEVFSLVTSAPQSREPAKSDVERSQGNGSVPTKPVIAPATPPPPQSSGGAGDSLSQLDQARLSCLRAHNVRRAEHGAAPLTLSEELNGIAQKWADYLGTNGKFEHSSGNQGIGENLAGNFSFNHNSGQEVTDMWYKEIKDYNFNKQGFSMATGHFTQVVWKSTKEIGLGVSQNQKNGMYVYVANYRPAGNMLGTFEQNVAPSVV